MNEIQTNLKNGVLSLILLRKGKLVIGKYKGHKTNVYELQKALKSVGITHGYLNNSISLIASGTAGQIPLAQAYIADEPGQLHYHFEKRWTKMEIMRLLQMGKFETVDLKQQVSKDDLLVSLTKAPTSILRYPDGRKENLNDLGISDLHFYSGRNVRISDKNKAIYANLNGLAFRDAFGVVSVAPVLIFKSIGKVHGHVSYDESLLVENDVRSGANIDSSANLFIGGVARSAKMEAAGTITVSFGLDNADRSELGQIGAGQSVFASTIRNYKIRAGTYILVKTTIDSSNIQCLNTVIAPKINASEIRVGNKLYAHTITGNTRVYLGPYFIKDAQYNKIKNFHAQHQRRLIDLKNEATILRDKIEHGKKNALIHLKKLKTVSPDSIPGDVLLNRYYTNLHSDLVKLDSAINKYERQINLISQERMRLAYYERQFIEDGSAEVICTGAIAAGTVISAPNHTMKLNSQRQNVSIKLDSASGKLELKQL